MDFEKLYLLYNKKEYIHPDPLEFLYNYKSPEDREIVALIASSLAYGRVAQILKSVDLVLKKMGENPSLFLSNIQENDLKLIYKGFKHRFTIEAELVSMLLGIKKIISDYSSLKNCFMSQYKNTDDNYINALESFIAIIKKHQK